MSVFSKLGFDKGDERGIYIGFHAGRVAWMFTTALLLLWSLYGILRTGNLPAQFVVLSASQVVFWISYLYYGKKLGS